MCWAAGAAGGARADSVAASPRDDESAYRAAVEDAVREFEAQHYEEARALFGQAHQIAPNARTHRGLGLCEFELRDYVGAVGDLQAALASPVKPLSAELREDTEKMLTRARQFVAEVQVTTVPGNSRVVVDGAPLSGGSPFSVLLSASEHRLQVSAPDFVAQERIFRIRGGEPVAISISLERPAREASSETGRRRWWLWGGVGVLVTGAAVGAGIALAHRGGTADPYGGSTDTLLSAP